MQVALVEGDLLLRKDLGDLFESIAENGSSVVYEGPVGQGIVDAVASNSFMPGILAIEDLANFEPTVREAVSTNYQGYDVISAPLPASGSIMMLALSILKRFNMTCNDDVIVPAAERRSSSAWQANAHYIYIYNQNGLQATSGFQLCFALGTFGAGGCPPKHVSNPDSVIKKIKSHSMHNIILIAFQAQHCNKED